MGRARIECLRRHGGDRRWGLRGPIRDRSLVFECRGDATHVGVRLIIYHQGEGIYYSLI